LGLELGVETITGFRVDERGEHPSNPPDQIPIKPAIPSQPTNQAIKIEIDVEIKIEIGIEIEILMKTLQQQLTSTTPSLWLLSSCSALMNT